MDYHQYISDPSGQIAEQERERLQTEQLSALMKEWEPKTPTETLLVQELLWHIQCHDPAKTRITIATLSKLQYLRNCKPEQKLQAIEGFYGGTKC